jgi:hypothetical protein
VLEQLRETDVNTVTLDEQIPVDPVQMKVVGDLMSNYISQGGYTFQDLLGTPHPKCAVTLNSMFYNMNLVYYSGGVYKPSNNLKNLSIEDSLPKLTSIVSRRVSEEKDITRHVFRS